MDQPPPPQSEIPNNVDIRFNDSPRTRRYGSDEPVVTPAELEENVNNNERRSSDPSPLAAAGHAPVPPVGEVTPQPTPGPPPTAARRRPRFLVKRACFCLSLQQGALFIGVLQVVNGILILLLEIMYLAGVLYAGAYTLNDDLTGTLPEHEQRWGPTDIAYASLSGFLLLQDLITLFFAGLLLHGVRTRRAGYIRGWLIFTAILLAIGVGSWAARITLEFMYKTTRGFALILRGLIYLTPPIYFLIVVRSFYHELLDERDGIVPFDGEGDPLMRGKPPPYTPSADDQAPALEPKRPLETNFDSTTPTTTSPPVYDTRFDLSVDDNDDDGGFGPGWIQTRGPVQDMPGPQSANVRLPSGVSETGPRNEEYTIPRVVATVSRDGEITPVLDRGAPPGAGGRKVNSRGQTEEDEDSDAVEFRPMTRRVIGAGPRVLPPLPPGHRESLQHVVMDMPMPPPSTAPTSF